jgi:hypothetical protein
VSRYPSDLRRSSSSWLTEVVAVSRVSLDEGGVAGGVGGDCWLHPAVAIAASRSQPGRKYLSRSLSSGKEKRQRLDREKGLDLSNP